MKIEKTAQDEILLLALVGEFDTLDTDRFAAEVAEALDGGTLRVVLVLDRMTFINSTALGSLLREQKRLNQCGGDMAAAAPSRLAREIFKTLGMDRRLHVFDTTARAVEYLRAGGGRSPPAGGGGGGGRVGKGEAADVRVAFSFPEQGGAKERTGELREIRTDGLVLSWENLDGVDPFAVFRPGMAVRTCFRLPLYHRTHEFRLAGTLAAADAQPGKKVALHVVFGDVPDVERSAIEKYLEDLRFLEEELPGPGAAPAKTP